MRNRPAGSRSSPHLAVLPTADLANAAPIDALAATGRLSDGLVGTYEMPTVCTVPA